MNRRRAAAMFATILTLPAMAGSRNLFGQSAEERIPLNLPGATTSIEPPADFEPIEASDEELARYGYPPRPDADRAPRAYATWQRAVAASTVRVIPELEVTELSAGPMRLPQARVSADSASISFLNWSGALAKSGAHSATDPSAIYYVQTELVVPAARQAYDTCDGKWDREMSWVGIDGLGSSDALQAGTESDAYCGKSGVATRYYAWFGWFPNSVTRVKNFPIAPGDDIFVEVWHKGATNAFAYLVNYQTNQTTTIGFAAPKGVSLIGDSAEWVVSRPYEGTQLATLTNYVSEYFSECGAANLNRNEYLVPGKGSSLQLDMVDSRGYSISYPTSLGDNALWLQYGSQVK